MMTTSSSQVVRIGRLLSAQERGRALMLFGLMTLGMGLETLCTGLIVPVIALMTQPEVLMSNPRIRILLAQFGSPSHSQIVLLAMCGLVAVYLIKNAFLALLAWRQARFAYSVQARMAQELFTTYLHQPYTFHLQRNSAQLIRNLTREVGIYTEALLSTLMLSSEALVFAGITALLLLVEPLGTLVAVAVLGGAGWTFHRLTRTRISRWGTAKQQHEGMRIQHLQQGLAGAKDVKLLGREAEFLGRHEVHNMQSAKIGQLQATLKQLPRLWLELLAVTGLAALVVVMLAQERSVADVLPTLALFAAAAFRLMPSMTRILASVQALRFCAPGVDVLSAELALSTKDDRLGRLAGIAIARLAFEIRLDHVAFAYPAAPRQSLNQVSVRIGKGECVGIVGPSGSGKSTLVDVMLGLLTPNSGSVTVDGRDIQLHLRSWQNQIGYVPQTIYLTDDSLLRNVAFGVASDKIDHDAVARSLRAAQLDEFVATLPDGVHTVVGERGVRLSGGQRQRIGIARALYHDPAVLVLDEATSALDTQTEAGVMSAVAAMRGSKTIVIVAHRHSTVEQCDRLYRLDQGRVVAEGAASMVLQMEHAVG